jgi:GNAT superfamily N-acetyltransferase
MFEIRKAVPEDALGITIVNVYTWETTYAGLMPDEVIDARIAELAERAKKCRADIEENDNFMVAAVGHTIIGFCCFGKSRSPAYRDSGELYAVYVLRGFQGTGAGKALFSAGARELTAVGCSSMIVNCLQGNPSLAFYRHMGGKVVAQRQDEIKDRIITENIIYFNIKKN